MKRIVAVVLLVAGLSGCCHKPQAASVSKEAPLVDHCQPECKDGKCHVR